MDYINSYFTGPSAPVANVADEYEPALLESIRDAIDKTDLVQQPGLKPMSREVVSPSKLAEAEDALINKVRGKYDTHQMYYIFRLYVRRQRYGWGSFQNIVERRSLWLSKKTQSTRWSALRHISCYQRRVRWRYWSIILPDATPLRLRSIRCWIVSKMDHILFRNSNNGNSRLFGCYSFSPSKFYLRYNSLCALILVPSSKVFI